MIRSHFQTLRRRKAAEENRNLTLRTIAQETGLAVGTVHRVSQDKLDRVNVTTLDALCRYFKVQSISELIEYLPDETVSAVSV